MCSTLDINYNLIIILSILGPCSADNYTAESIAIVDYILDEEEAGCSLLDMVITLFPTIVHENGVLPPLFSHIE